MYIPYKSAHPRHTIKKYVLGELKRYVRVNTEEINFLKIKNKFFLRMRNRGFKKNKLAQWFSQIKYSNRTKSLDGNPDDTCYYQCTRETLADTTLIKIGEGIFREALVTNTLSFSISAGLSAKFYKRRNALSAENTISANKHRNLINFIGGGHV